jgi:23S rRNA (adenine2503-C2)-methyltransferase
LERVGRKRLKEVSSTVRLPGKTAIHSLLLDELTARVVELGERGYRGKQIADWLFKKRVASYDEMTDVPQALRTALAAEYEITGPEIVRVLGSKDTTQKFCSA